MSESPRLENIVKALKTAVATLREAEVPFLLAGSAAAWARGGPPPVKDLDLMLRPADAERALSALQEAGMRTERPPEEWLVKAWCGEVLIDLIFSPSGLELDDEAFDRAELIAVEAISTPVMAIEDVLVTKLMSLDEHELNYTPLLTIARALREQIDWQQLRVRTGHSPYAQGFFTLVRELRLDTTAAAVATPRGRSRVRVVSS